MAGKPHCILCRTAVVTSRGETCEACLSADADYVEPDVAEPETPVSAQAATVGADTSQCLLCGKMRAPEGGAPCATCAALLPPAAPPTRAPAPSSPEPAQDLAALPEDHPPVRATASFWTEALGRCPRYVGFRGVYSGADAARLMAAHPDQVELYEPPKPRGTP